MSKKIKQKMWQLIIKWNKPGNIKEYTIDLPFALAFLPASDLKKSLSDIYMNLPTQDNIHQGYLLVTIGEKQCKNQ